MTQFIIVMKYWLQSCAMYDNPCLSFAKLKNCIVSHSPHFLFPFTFTQSQRFQIWNSWQLVGNLLSSIRMCRWYGSVASHGCRKPLLYASNQKLLYLRQNSRCLLKLFWQEVSNSSDMHGKKIMRTYVYKMIQTHTHIYTHTHTHTYIYIYMGLIAWAY